MAETQVEDRPHSFENRRKMEMEAGRRRVQERMSAAGQKSSEFKDHFKRAEDEIKADEERRERLFNDTPAIDKAEADRAGAEVADQAQTQLEAVQHLADRNEPIIDFRRERIIERLEGDADPRGAEEVTRDLVTAQAVHQPTPMASMKGLETEDRPLNNSDFRDEELALDRVTTPDDQHAPKTEEQAREVAAAKVPETEAVVVAGWHLGPGDNPEKVEQVVDLVRSADDLVLDGPEINREAPKRKGRKKADTEE
jgi:hypothetical protein